jgi:hypothetical protein
MSNRLSWIATLSLLIANVSLAAPAQVVILRHAEKPKSGDDLNSQGYERADALPGLFETDPALTKYGTPAAIYAMDQSSAATSNRPVETVTPLARALQLPLQDKFTIDDIQPLVSAIMSDSAYDGKTVVICWEHKGIPSIVQAFGYDDAPAKWKKKVFDRLWILHFKGDKVASFEDLPPDLLPGDSKN